MNNRLLAVITPLSGYLVDKDTVVLTEKFVEGMKVYADYWKGPVKVIAHSGVDTTGNLDHRRYKIDDLPFDVALINFNNFALIIKEIENADVVLGGSIHYLNGIAEYCRNNQIVYVHCSEYTLKTRWQIVNASTTNPIKRLKNYLWEWNQERKNKNEIKLSAAIQCNGAPVYEQYKEINKDCMLYFDNRITEESLAATSELPPLPNQFDHKRPIQLAFSGRLNRACS